jgi:CRISPR-associated protein Csy2
VPLPVGYGAISPLYEAGQVANARDDQTPFRFVECLYSLGEWKSPHRIQGPDELLWHHQADPEHGLYLCKTRRQAA